MLEIGSVIDGKYKILNKIGQGGMSVVYLAMNERANKQWAIKEVRKDGVSNFEVVKQGLIAETDLLKKLNHPHLPSIIDIIDGEDTFLIVMDYIEGVSLSKKLKEFGTAIPQEYVIDWGIQLCDVLGYLHSRQPAIIYRDMKPSNVMLRPDGNVMLIDFGTAREFKSRNVADTVCLGTQGYAAPEQYGGMGQTDARTDIYCLGATLYHLVTGHNPAEYPYEMYPIRNWNPALSSGLESIIIKCTQKNPNDRYQSCAELMYALEHFEDYDVAVRKKQKSMLRSFAAVSLASVMFLGASGLFKYMSIADNKYHYEQYLSNSVGTSDFTDLSQAASLFPKKSGPYDKAMEIIDKDGVFTSEESQAIKRELINTSNKNFDTLKSSNPLEYYSLCYKLGLEYFCCYEDDVLGWANSQKWFEEVINNKERNGLDATKNENAQILYELSAALYGLNSQEQSGSVYQFVPGTEDTKTGEVDEKKTYREFWNKLTGITDLDFFSNANSVTKRKVYTWIYSQMFGNYDKLISGGVSTNEMLTFKAKALEDLKEMKKNATTSEAVEAIDNLIDNYETVDNSWS